MAGNVLSPVLIPCNLAAMIQCLLAAKRGRIPAPLRLDALARKLAHATPKGASANVSMLIQNCLDFGLCN